MSGLRERKLRTEAGGCARYGTLTWDPFTKTSMVRVSRVIEVCASKCLAAKIRSFQLSICIFYPLDTVFVVIFLRGY